MREKSGNITSPELRKKIILELLKDQDFVSIKEILKRVEASEITIRRDLIDLEGKGLLIRTHGGATKKITTDNLFAFNDKINQNKESKDYICKIATGFIKSNDIIFIDCGSTVSFLVKYIKNIEHLTVITNSLPIVSALINYENIELILIGGAVDNKRRAIYGRSAIQSVAQYHANKAFIGVDGISLAKGLTSFDEKMASVTLQMTENSDEVFLLCDSTKIEKNSFVKFAPLTIVDYIITDNQLDPALKSEYKKHNIHFL